MSTNTRRGGFTLIELLVVIAIIAILIGLLVPAVQKVREAATRSECQNNLHQMGIALHAYHGVNNRFPPGVVNDNDPTFPYWSWMAMMMPYFEQNNLYLDAEAWAKSGATGNYWPWGYYWESPKTPANPALSQIQPGLICQSDARESYVQLASAAGLYNGNPPSNVAFTGYLGVAGSAEGNEAFDGGHSNGILYWTSRVRLADVTDGTSNTLLVGERPPSTDLEYGWWFAGSGWDGSGVGDVVLSARAYNYATAEGCPTTSVGFQAGKVTNKCDQMHWWSLHPGGGNFLMADGSVRFLSYPANAILPQMCSRNGGESVDEMDY